MLGISVGISVGLSDGEPLKLGRFVGAAENVGT